MSELGDVAYEIRELRKEGLRVPPIEFYGASTQEHEEHMELLRRQVTAMEALVDLTAKDIVESSSSPWNWRFLLFCMVFGLAVGFLAGWLL